MHIRHHPARCLALLYPSVRCLVYHKEIHIYLEVCSLFWFSFLFASSDLLVH